MKRKNLLLIIMIAVMMSGGCGNEEAGPTVGTEITESSGIEVSQENELPAGSKEVKQEEIAKSSEPADIDSLITEKTDDELDLKQYLFSYEDRTMDKKAGEQVFQLDWFMDDIASDAESFLTTDKVNLYNINGIRVGYTLKDTWLETFGEYNGWYFFYLDGQQRFAKVEDVLANSKTVEQAKEEEQKAEEAFRQEYEDRNNKTEEQQSSMPATTEPVTVPEEQPTENVTTDNGKYTPEEAIAVYRSLMEEGGITWSPEIKDVVSWGTGFLYLDKGQPEWAASSSLESFAIGSHGGDSWTKFYIEVTGSDDECVYYTMWGA